VAYSNFYKRQRCEKIGYKKNKMSTDRESGKGNKRARVTRGSRNPKHGAVKTVQFWWTIKILDRMNSETLTMQWNLHLFTKPKSFFDV
jgi:hypothetical protein